VRRGAEAHRPDLANRDFCTEKRPLLGRSAPLCPSSPCLSRPSLFLLDRPPSLLGISPWLLQTSRKRSQLPGARQRCSRRRSVRSGISSPTPLVSRRVVHSLFWTVCCALADSLSPSLCLGRIPHNERQLTVFPPLPFPSSPGDGKRNRPSPPHHDEGKAGPQGPSCEDLRHALVQRQAPSRLGFSRRQAHRLGRLHHQQGPRHSAPLLLGHDLCVCTLREFCRLRWSRQRLLRLQPKDPRRERKGGSGAERPHRLPLLLPVPQRPTNLNIER
jgi:hypothetical protein